MRIFTSAVLFYISVNICFADLQIILPIPKENTQQQEQLTQNTIASVHQNFNNHKYSCEQFISSYLNKIKKYNLALNRGAPLNAYVAINPEIIQQARELDNYYSQNSQLIGPLHCIPIIIKDNIDSID